MNVILSTAFTRVMSLIRPSETTIIRNFAARKGTRERKRKKVVKKEVQKVGFIPFSVRKKQLADLERRSKRINDLWKQPNPTDNVWVTKYYQWKVYPFAEAVHCFRETHHPTMYNLPNAFVNACIELNMTAEKKTRYMDNIHRTCGIPHTFNHGEERTLLAFVKDESSVEHALAAGASLAGGMQLIKSVQNGEIALQDYQYVVAHPDILHELVLLRGLLKKKFPNVKLGTLGADIPTLVKRFINGVQYSAIKDDFEPDYAAVNVTLGTLNMDVSHLEANFAAILQDLHSLKPRRTGDFITRSLITCQPSSERFKVNYKQYTDAKDVTDSSSDSSDSDEEFVDSKQKVAGV